MLIHSNLFHQFLEASEFISFTAFNLAHWFFAFSYLVLSFRIELTKNKLPEDTYNCRLNAVNIFVCLFNVIVPAIIWIYDIKREYKVAGTAIDIG